MLESYSEIVVIFSDFFVSRNIFTSSFNSTIFESIVSIIINNPDFACDRLSASPLIINLRSSSDLLVFINSSIDLFNFFILPNSLAEAYSFTFSELTY